MVDRTLEKVVVTDIKKTWLHYKKYHRKRNKEKMKRILITGSSGFLGSRLAYYLKDKYELLLPSHEELNVSREEAVKTYM